MTEKGQTEVVKIRLGSEDKVTLQEIAANEFRSFADQCRLALHEWLLNKRAPVLGAEPPYEAPENRSVE